MHKMKHLQLLFFAACSYALVVNETAATETYITVSLSGDGNFDSIQKAIDSIPDNNLQWTRVHIAAGVYREKVNISYTKSNVILEGEGAEKTSIEWGDYSTDSGGHDTLSSATFTTSATNFLAIHITFKNTAYAEIMKMRQAVAVSVLGSKSAFFKCSFLGLQDTLFDGYGLHYFKDCYIEGYVDFIFGNGQSIYEGCSIHSTKGEEAFAGFITANFRNGPGDPSGFVFKSCTISGSQNVYLGRPWNSYSRVIFYESTMESTVHPQGWSPWDPSVQLSSTTFVEYNCVGPGSDRSQRVKWEKDFTDREVAPFVDLSYINKDAWLESLPKKLIH